MMWLRRRLRPVLSFFGLGIADVDKQLIESLMQLKSERVSRSISARSTRGSFCAQRGAFLLKRDIKEDITQLRKSRL